MTTFRLSLLPYKLNHSHLHQLVHGLDLIKIVEEILDGRGLRDVTECDERVALACRVGFLRQISFTLVDKEYTHGSKEGI